MKEVYVLKRKSKHSEPFDPLKLHRSIASACMAVRALEGEAHITAQKVCGKVLDWLLTKTEVTSADIRRVTTTHLQQYHPEAAYLYEQHRSIM